MSAPGDLAAFASPLPATEVNLSRGAAWTWMVFAATVATGSATIVATQSTGGAVENAFLAVVIAVCAFIAALTISVLPEILIGMPLTILCARLLRQTASIWPHLVAQFVAGASTATATCGIAVSLFEGGWSEENLNFFGGYLVGVIVCAGLSSAAGWALALRGHRRRVRTSAADNAHVRELETP